MTLSYTVKSLGYKMMWKMSPYQLGIQGVSEMSCRTSYILFYKSPQQVFRRMFWFPLFAVNIQKCFPDKEPEQACVELIMTEISLFGWTIPLRWASGDCQSAVSTSEPCPSPEWERPQRASSSWTMCPPPFSTISLSSTSIISLEFLWMSWTHTSRYVDFMTN